MFILLQILYTIICNLKKMESENKSYPKEMPKREDKPRDPKSKKRTYDESFGPREYDSERYGQEIDVNFFQTNVGHAVIG